MMRQNAHVPSRLEDVHKKNGYFLLYYQFVKHSFGLQYISNLNPTRIRLYFDQFPRNNEKCEQFKEYIYGLQNTALFNGSNILIDKQDITEIRSHDHVLIQCLDVVLGAITFRLNDKHKEKIPGKRIRGKRTRAKEKLYKAILKEIRTIYRKTSISG